MFRWYNVVVIPALLSHSPFVVVYIFSLHINSDSEDSDLKYTQQLIPPEVIAGNWKGNGCCCTPASCRLKIKPACCGRGICVYHYCGSYRFPFFCRYMVKCGKCYFDCDDDSFWTPDVDTLDMKFGRGFVRVEMER